MVTPTIISILESELRLSARTYSFKDMGDWTTYTNAKFKNIEGTLGIFYKKWKRNYEQEILRNEYYNTDFEYKKIMSKV